MSDSYVLVTGVSGLIGKAVADELARQGKKVVGLVRRQDILRWLHFHSDAS